MQDLDVIPPPLIQTPLTSSNLPTTRLPHLGHALLFLLLTLLAFLLCEGATLVATHRTTYALFITAAMDQRLQLVINILTYGIALTAAWFVLPLLWHRTFLTGLRWNAAALRPGIAGFGLLLGFLSQAATTLLPHPKDMPIEALFRNPALIWILVVFGTFIAPLFEEIFFRGLLLPGIAIAVDYMRLGRPADRLQALNDLDRWRSSEGFSPLALVVSSLVTSLLFALIHAPQLGKSWPAVALLAVVSMVLCAVRLRTRSLAASTLVHAVYNGSVFLTIGIATHGFRHLDRM